MQVTIPPPGYFIFAADRYSRATFMFLKHLRLLPLIALLLSVAPARAQHKVANMPEHDTKAYYFGLSFGLNSSQYRIQYSDAFTATDTFKRIQPKWGAGFNLGLMANLKLNRFVDLRFVPTLAFAEKGLQYNQPLTDRLLDKTVESIYMILPLELKFKSDRLRNFRFYGLAGGRFDYDLAANARSRKMDEFLKIKPVDFGAELGCGIELYYPNFIFSPEIKVSQGFLNQIYQDKSLPLTNGIQSIKTRMIVFSIHLEG